MRRMSEMRSDFSRDQECPFNGQGKQIKICFTSGRDRASERVAKRGIAKRDEGEEHNKVGIAKRGSESRKRCRKSRWRHVTDGVAVVEDG